MVRRVVAVVAGVALAGAGALASFASLWTAPASATPILQLEPAHAEHTPAFDGTEPIFILLIGSDARPGEDIARLRADSIHILALDAGGAHATLLGFPRDSWVEVPGHGTTKINAAMTIGGPELLVATIEQLTGITMDYYALTWFDGFVQMIQDIGGLTIDIPFAMDDPLYSRASFEPGVQTITGREALAFARDRHDLPMGDFGRSENQGRLIVAAVAQLRAEFADDPSRLLDWLAAGLRSSETSLPFDEVLALAWVGLRLDPATITNAVVPGGTGMVGDSSVVLLSSNAPTIYADLADDGLLDPANVPPSPNASLLD